MVCFMLIVRPSLINLFNCGLYMIWKQGSQWVWIIDRGCLHLTPDPTSGISRGSYKPCSLICICIRIYILVWWLFILVLRLSLYIQRVHYQPHHWLTRALSATDWDGVLNTANYNRQKSNKYSASLLKSSVVNANQTVTQDTVHANQLVLHVI
jgi:hypothetical protein